MKYDEHHTLQWPEELLCWNHPNGWAMDVLRRNKLSPLAFRVTASKAETGKSITRWNTSNPLILTNGVEIIDGVYGTTTQSRYGHYTLRVDSVAEFNQCLCELAVEHLFETFFLQRAVIYNYDKGAEIIYEWFNPDGLGKNLYFSNVIEDGKARSYKEVPFYEQQELTNYFYDYFAACKVVSETRLKATCAITHK